MKLRGMFMSEVSKEINQLKAEKNAIILAHNYQLPEVQDIADHVGDSLELAKIAAKTDAEIIVFCGVDFMAETAAFLAPDKCVLLPDTSAVCPMAQMITPEDIKGLREKYPGVPIVCYINTSAEVKALSDICCTSSNAVDVVRSLDSDKVIFVPDRNLGAYVGSKVDKEVILWEGYCATHHRVNADEVEVIKKYHQDGTIMVHPECKPEVVRLADYVGSTGSMIQYASQAPGEKFIIGTEMGLIHKLKNENPEKSFYLLSQSLICPNMKYNTNDKILKTLQQMEPKIVLDKDIQEKAARTVQRMFDIN